MPDDPPSAARTADVTVIVTSYNHQAFLEQCLDSIAGQTWPPRQVVIVDDRSTDDSANLIDQWLAETRQPYTFIRHGQNRGLTASLNEALALAEGGYLVHISGDDWFEPDRLERQASAFALAPQNVALVVSDIREVDTGGSTIVEHDYRGRLAPLTAAGSQRDALSALLAENVIAAPGVMMRTALVREIGGYDEGLVFEDYDLWLRLSVLYPIEYVPGIVTNYRVVTTSFTRNEKRRVSMLTSEAAMLAKHVGESDERNEIISRRLVAIAGQLLELDASEEFRRVLTAAIAATNTRWLRRARREARLPGGMSRLLHREYAEFGLTESALETKERLRAAAKH